MLVPLLLLAMTVQEPDENEDLPLDEAQIKTAGEVIGIEYTDDEAELMLRGVVRNLRSFEALQRRSLENGVPNSLVFDPWLGRPGASAGWAQAAPWRLPEVDVERPADLEQLAFADLATLAALIRSKKVSCVELTEMYLRRLEDLDRELSCVITFTEERAMAQAKARDEELARGEWRGPLHGIPWGAKDLLAVEGYPTTWGAKPYEHQELDHDAAVVERLDEAGAVLIAKLTLGALAWGDVWFGGTTKNPWKPEQGSSGSSAGSSSATAAGGVAFAIGSETWGSIVSPSDRCGNSALRPTFGRVSRHGAMALAWSLDKLGPICRSVQDAALVFEAIHGSDRRDVSTLYHLGARNPEKPVEKVGFFARALEESDDEDDSRAAEYRAVLDQVEALGVELVPVELPDYPVSEMMLLLNVEAACAFDELTRSGRDDELVRQERMAWPNVFRQSRLVPAVEYVRANRLRTLLMQDMAKVMEGIDVIVHPSFAGSALTLTNLTGHPTVVAPYGFREDGTPFSISFTGGLYEDERLLRFAHRWQESTEHHLKHPNL